MNKVSRIFYRLLSSLAMFVAVTSTAQLFSFCILIIHQPEVPEKLRRLE